MMEAMGPPPAEPAQLLSYALRGFQLLTHEVAPCFTGFHIL